MDKQYKITKSSDPKLLDVIFECVIIKDMAAPKWFQEFVKSEFKPLVTKVENIENRLTSVENRLETVIKLNNLRTE